MTPAERKFDQDLIKSLRVMAQNIFTRSRKISDTLKLAADRLEMLLAQAPLVPTPPIKQHEPAQPASTPDQASKPER